MDKASTMGFSFGGSGRGVTPSNPTSRLLSDFRSGLRSTQSLQRGPPDPAKDIHRMLESYSTDISKTESEIDNVNNQLEAAEESQRERESELEALRGAAAAAAEETADLAHQVQHLQSEVASKKNHSNELMSKIAEVLRQLEDIRQAVNQQREQFLLQSEKGLAAYRRNLHGKDGSWCEAAGVER